MKKIVIFSMLMLINHILSAQFSFKAIIKSERGKEPLAGATLTVKEINRTFIADSTGFVIVKNISAGKATLMFSYVGHEEKTIALIFPLNTETVTTVFLEEAEEEAEEIIVSSTRTSRTIANTPTRVEVIDGEELDEKSNMRPANVSMLLHESTGLQVQQTSAVSGNASIRVQGLDGRYTQLLKDGYPNFGNFASGLSILEIPPLDLKQVEIIKGPASTLYGGGAIAGAVNFISKTPKEKPELSFIINQSNIGQTNTGMYASAKKGKFGYRILGLLNLQKAYDVDKDDFSELSKSNNFTITPALFFYPKASTTVMIGNQFTKGSNTGGDMHVIDGKADNVHVYFEKNSTIRNTSTFEFDRKYSNTNALKLKQSVSFFSRKINIPNYFFRGKSINSFSDLSYSVYKEKYTLIAGANFLFDQFKQQAGTTAGSLDTKSFTGGLYVQDTRDISSRVKLESGIRFDHINWRNTNEKQNRFFILPRISGLFKISDKVSSRIGGGLGYKIPTIFTEQTETIQYQDVLPLNKVSFEKSIGATADINYKTRITPDLQFSINQLFFYTKIDHPLVLADDLSGNKYFSNAAKPIQSRGFETNMKLVFRNNLKFFLGYTYTDAKARYLPVNQFLPLLPKNKLNLALVYEKEQNLKLGMEAYYSGSQYLYNGSSTPAFWEFGMMAEKIFNKISLFINFENFTDQRQSKYKRVVNPPNNDPTFDDIWNHQEGFVLNGGIKIRL